ncbi:MAG: WG repeat-containing protein [Clostridiales bacterium]|nr:WG repeat-containing protein [Clostridiales bacterium]
MRKIFVIPILMMVLLASGCATTAEAPDDKINIFEIFDEVDETEDYFIINGKGAYYNTQSDDIALAAPWQRSLAHLLMSNYPSLVSEEAKNKTQELVEAVYTDKRKIFEMSQNDIPLDVTVSIPKDIDGYYNIVFYAPWDYAFYDLDNDGIPELFISGAVINGEISYSHAIYKFNGNSYLRIGSSDGDLYIDPQSRIVCIGAYSVQLFDLSGDTIVHSEYVDLMGSKAYEGVPYSEIGFYSDLMNRGDEENADFMDYLKLKPFPEFDCSDILAAIKHAGSKEPVFYASGVIPIDVLDSSIFDKSVAEKVMGADNLYWYARPQYDFEDMQAIGWSGMWAVKKDGKYGVIDALGNTVLPFEYEFRHNCFDSCLGTDFNAINDDTSVIFVSNNGVIVKNSDWWGHGGGQALWDTKSGRSLYSDESYCNYYTFEMETIVSSVEVTDWYDHDLEDCGTENHEGCRLSYEYPESPKYGISIDDELTAPLIYDYIKDNYNFAFYYDYEYVEVDGVRQGWLKRELHEHTDNPPQDLFAAKTDGKAGFINMYGEAIIPFIFEETDTFNNGVAAVKLGGKWGFVIRDSD